MSALNTVLRASQSKLWLNLAAPLTVREKGPDLLRGGRRDAESLRLAYAQHVYRQQDARVDRAVVLTGGWQTSRESAYVQATRARHGTDWYLARDQLGMKDKTPTGSPPLPSA